MSSALLRRIVASIVFISLLAGLVAAQTKGRRASEQFRRRAQAHSRLG